MIKLILLDVDGTLTDRGIYKGNSGEELKKFHVRDGYKIVYVNKYLNKKFGIITGKESKIVADRAKELKIEILYQGVSDKLAILEKIMKEHSLKKEEIAYIGDDLNDLRIMKEVGLKGAPSDAIEEILEIADFVSTKEGGNGAVREFIEFIVKKEELWQEFTNKCK